MSDPGRGIAVLVNANAKRGGRRVAAEIGRALKGANVRLTRTPEEIDQWLRILPDPRCILSAGGDGTAMALLTALRRKNPSGPFPTVGLLRLGTGNGWARATGALKLGETLRLLAESPGAFPTRDFGVVDVEGQLCPFAGSGWDGMILNDYKDQLKEAKGATLLTKSIYGYLTAIVTRTVPKAVVQKRPSMVVENLGDEVFTIDPAGNLVQLPGAKKGTVLYEGTFGVTGFATTAEFGYGFRAFPFAERLPGFGNFRVYDGHPLRALSSIRPLWFGRHPMPGMSDWFTTGIRMTFNRPVPFQIGGDAVGERRVVEYRLADMKVPLLDWRRLRDR